MTTADRTSARMTNAERTYRLLLRAYPTAFRAHYEREMLLLFRDQYRRAPSHGAAFWIVLLLDIARSAPAERLRGDMHVHKDIGGVMKTFGILAILVGAFEAFNAATEAWLGGIQNGDSASLAGGGVAAIAGMVLAIAGIALLMRSGRAVQFARVAAGVMMVVFVAIRFLDPRLSVFATLLAVVFPAALLIYLKVSGAGGSRAQVA